MIVDDLPLITTCRIRALPPKDAPQGFNDYMYQIQLPLYARSTATQVGGVCILYSAWVCGCSHWCVHGWSPWCVVGLAGVWLVSLVCGWSHWCVAGLAGVWLVSLVYGWCRWCMVGLAGVWLVSLVYGWSRWCVAGLAGVWLVLGTTLDTLICGMCIQPLFTH